jgi:hypothetical protein
MLKRPVPTFYKGDLVHAHRPGLVAWRRATPEEKSEWYKQNAIAVAEGRAFPFDSAGEPHLAPADVFCPVEVDDPLQVTRGRVTAPLSYGNAKDCCEVLNLRSGETLFVKRVALTKV